MKLLTTKLLVDRVEQDICWSGFLHILQNPRTDLQNQIQ